MKRVVIDASAAVECLLRTRLGQKIEYLLDDAFLLAPALLDVEVLSVLRRAVLSFMIAGKSHGSWLAGNQDSFRTSCMTIKGKLK